MDRIASLESFGPNGWWCGRGGGQGGGSDCWRRMMRRRGKQSSLKIAAVRHVAGSRSCVLVVQTVFRCMRKTSRFECFSCLLQTATMHLFSFTTWSGNASIVLPYRTALSFKYNRTKQKCISCQTGIFFLHVRPICQISIQITRVTRFL
jgi:hypothetical protein